MSNSHLSPTRARGCKEVVCVIAADLIQELRDNWRDHLKSFAILIGGFGLFAFCMWAVMLLWPDGGAQ